MLRKYFVDPIAQQCYMSWQPQWRPSFTVPLLSAERGGRWRGILKSITVPSGMFVSLAGFILFMKRYPHCSLSQIIAGLRTNRTPQAHHQSANIQVRCRCSGRCFLQFGLESQSVQWVTFILPNNCCTNATKLFQIFFFSQTQDYSVDYL